MYTLADKYLKDSTLAAIKVADLAEYAGVDMTAKPKPTKKTIAAKLRAELTTEQQIQDLYTHFQEQLAIPAPVVCRMLRLTKTEYRWMTEAGHLPVVREVYTENVPWDGWGTTRYHDAWTVLHAYPQTIDEWRAAHKAAAHVNRSTAAKTAATKAKATRKANAAVSVPEWITNLTFAWPYGTPPDIDELVTRCATTAIAGESTSALQRLVQNERENAFSPAQRRALPLTAAWRGVMVVNNRVEVIVSIDVDRVAWLFIRDDNEHKYMFANGYMYKSAPTKWRTKLPVKQNANIREHIENRLRTALAGAQQALKKEARKEDNLQRIKVWFDSMPGKIKTWFTGTGC